eukprot:5658433-Prymnesium_polylepis.3
MSQQAGVEGHIFQTVGSGVKGGGSRTPGYVAYGATKRGLPQMTDSLVQELTKGVRRAHLQHLLRATPHPGFARHDEPPPSRTFARGYGSPPHAIAAGPRIRGRPDAGHGVCAHALPRDGVHGSAPRRLHTKSSASFPFGVKPHPHVRSRVLARVPQSAALHAAAMLPVTVSHATIPSLIGAHAAPALPPIAALHGSWTIPTLIVIPT